jgi:large subunit ribosomal protein L21
MQSYAVVKTGGKQYTVKKGDILKVELLTEANDGDTVALDTLAVNAGGDMTFGTPELEQKVNAVVLGRERAAKIVVFKKRKTSTYRRKNGHRQNLHKIEIASIPGE